MTRAAAALYMTAAYSLDAAGPAAERPNVVLVLADEGFSCYGDTSYRTPHIDALAASGIRFDRAYSMPLCTLTPR